MRVPAIVAFAIGCLGVIANRAQSDAAPAATAASSWVKLLPSIRRDLPARGAEVEHRASLALDRDFILTLSEEITARAAQKPPPAQDWLTTVAFGQQPYPFAWPSDSVGPPSPSSDDLHGVATKLAYIIVIRTDRHDDAVVAADGDRLRTERRARFRGWAFVYDATHLTRVATVRLEATGGSAVATRRPGIESAFIGKMNDDLARRVIADMRARLR